MKAADRFVEVAGQHQEGDQHAEIDRAVEHLKAADSQDHHHPDIAEEVHRGAVDRPVAHDNEGSFAEGIA